MHHTFHKNIKQQKLFSTLIIIIIRNVSNHHIRMIPEGSCDTEDLGNDAENTALITGINYILKYINMVTLNYKYFLQYYSFLLYF